MKYISSVIFTGGNAPSFPILPWSCTFCIAADKGVENCKRWKYTPHYIIGDFDSVTKREAVHVFPKAKIISFIQKKTSTDTELALIYAYNLGSNDITLIGGEGGMRVDHFIEILTFYNKVHAPHRIITATQQIEHVSEGQTLFLKTKKNATISLFSVGTGTTSQKTKGLYWNLDNVNLSREKTSMSNIAISNSIEVTVYKGSLIVIWKHENHVQRPIKKQEK